MKYVYLLVIDDIPQAFYNTLTEAAVARRDEFDDYGEIRKCTLTRQEVGTFLLEDFKTFEYTVDEPPTL